MTSLDDPGPTLTPAEAAALRDQPEKHEVSDVSELRLDR